jgi:hypothetical protein
MSFLALSPQMLAHWESVSTGTQILSRSAAMLGAPRAGGQPRNLRASRGPEGKLAKHNDCNNNVKL